MVLFEVKLTKLLYECQIFVSYPMVKSLLPDVSVNLSGVTALHKRNAF
jgi:hypothetical protein